jgi:hypothetical protein
VVSFEDYKKSLGKAAEGLSDKEIEASYVLSDMLAGAIFDACFKGRIKKGEGETLR